MKRTFAIVLSMIFIVSALASCDQFKNLGSNKAEEEKKRTEEITAQVAQKLAEEQKKAAEERAKMQQQIDSEVQRRLSEKEAEMKKATETQAQAKAPQPEPTKVVEHVIVKEKVPTTPSPKTAEQPVQVAKLSGYIHVYTDSQLSGKNWRIPFGNNINTTDGTAFKDNITSIEYQIPNGWQVALYEDSGYGKKRYVIKEGSGTIGHLPPYMNDNISSIRWERAGR